MKKRIVLLAFFSNEEVRNHLKLKYPLTIRVFRRLLNKPGIVSRDLSSWISAYVKIFEMHDEYEYHVVSMHAGMSKAVQEFSIRGIHYHFVKRELGFWGEICDRLVHFQRRNNYGAEDYQI